MVQTSSRLVSFMLPSPSHHWALIIHKMTQKYPRKNPSMLGAPLPSMSHPCLCIFIEFMGSQGAPVSLSRHVSPQKCGCILRDGVCNNGLFAVLNDFSKHHSKKIKVPTWRVSMDAMYCHGMTKTAGCEKVLPQTSIWISSSVLSKAPAHLREYTCTGCLVHSIDSAQQSVCQPSVSRSCFGFLTRLTQTGGVCFNKIYWENAFFSHKASQLLCQLMCIESKSGLVARMLPVLCTAHCSQHLFSFHLYLMSTLNNLKCTAVKKKKEHRHEKEIRISGCFVRDLLRRCHTDFFIHIWAVEQHNGMAVSGVDVRDQLIAVIWLWD